MSVISRFITVPCGLGIRNGWPDLDLSGTLEAPAKILSHALVSAFPQSQVISLPAGSAAPYRCDRDYFSAVHSYCQQCLLALIAVSPGDSFDILLGGDHLVGFPSVCAKLRQLSANRLGLLLIDSHGELHQPSTSPSGNFHGMWLRALVDRFENSDIDALCPEKLPVENILIVGNLHLEEEEKRFITRHNIQVVSEQDFLSNPEKFRLLLGNFCRRFRHLHISLDLDVVKGGSVAVNLPEAGGMEISSLLAILDCLPVISSLSSDLVEVNTYRINALETVDLAQRIIRKLSAVRFEEDSQDALVSNL